MSFSLEVGLLWWFWRIIYTLGISTLVIFHHFGHLWSKFVQLWLHCVWPRLLHMVLTEFAVCNKKTQLQTLVKSTIFFAKHNHSLWGISSRMHHKVTSSEHPHVGVRAVVVVVCVASAPPRGFWQNLQSVTIKQLQNLAESTIFCKAETFLSGNFITYAAHSYIVRTISYNRSEASSVDPLFAVSF